MEDADGPDSAILRRDLDEILTCFRYGHSPIEGLRVFFREVGCVSLIMHLLTFPGERRWISRPLMIGKPVK